MVGLATLLVDSPATLMMMVRLIVMGGILVSTAGCGGVGGVYMFSHTINFTKPGMTQQQLDADWYACRKENISDSQSGASLSEEQMAKQCMAAKGYSSAENGF